MQTATFSPNQYCTPSFNDILDNNDAGLGGKILSRYLFSRNPERTEKLHRFLGAAITRKLIMGTYGKYYPRRAGSNYRTDPNVSRLESATNFAVGGSVFNELYHTAVAAAYIPSLLDGNVEQYNLFGFALNMALVSLQRYNRARMTIRINEELAKGETYSPSYSNYLGIDGSALDD